MRTFPRLVLFALVLHLALPAVADAQSLKLRQYFKAEEERLEQQEEATNQVCDTEIEVELDWSDYDAEASEGYSPYGYCDGGPLTAMRILCRDGEMAKTAVQESIQKVVCTFGDERGIALEDGVVHYTISWDSTDDYEHAKEYLLENL